MTDRIWDVQLQAAFVELDVANERLRPFVLLRARIFQEGNVWCALYGDNIQEGVAGFGETPEKASYDFDKRWANAKLGKDTP